MTSENWIARFKQHSFVQQQNHDQSTTLAFTIPREYILQPNHPIDALFHGGLDSPSLNAIDPQIHQPVHITKYLYLKSKASTSDYLAHLYEHIHLTSQLSHVNVRRILSWYIADGCLYSITSHIQRTLRHAIQTEQFSIERIRFLTSQILQGTFYLQCQGLSPLTPWYTTNIDLAEDDQIRLCSPTIAMTKLNGGTVQHHHLWRHAPESLIRMIFRDSSSSTYREFDRSKEDVWSIACIIVEMMIKTILFRPSNDDPILQLYCIVQLVGGMSNTLLQQIPKHSQQMFSSLKIDLHQRRLHYVLKQIFHQYQISSIEHRYNEHLYHLLSQLFQFQSEKRLSLTATLEHPFFSMRPINTTIIPFDRKTRHSIGIDDLIRLAIKFNLQQTRWMLTLKERCFLQILLRIKDFSQFNADQLVLSQLLRSELTDLCNFFTGNL